MHIKVKLYGTLARQVEGYDHGTGMEVSLPEGGKLEDLVAVLGIAKKSVSIVTQNGDIIKADNKLFSGDEIRFFSIVAGG